MINRCYLGRDQGPWVVYSHLRSPAGAGVHPFSHTINIPAAAPTPKRGAIHLPKFKGFLLQCNCLIRGGVMDQLKIPSPGEKEKKHLYFWELEKKSDIRKNYFWELKNVRQWRK